MPTPRLPKSIPWIRSARMAVSSVAPRIAQKTAVPLLLVPVAEGAVRGGKRREGAVRGGLYCPHRLSPSLPVRH